jgi:hypothetical protein
MRKAERLNAFQQRKLGSSLKDDTNGLGSCQTSLMEASEQTISRATP